MLDQLLPRSFDNTYRGHKLALWLFGLLILLKVLMGVNSIFNAYMVASSADGIPLDTFPPAAAQTITSLFALLGISNVVICLFSLLVLARYRAMVPLMFALLLLELMGKRMFLYVEPIFRTGTPPSFYLNLVLLGVMSLGLVLSLLRRNNTEIDATRSSESA